MSRQMKFRIWDVQALRYLEEAVMWSVAKVPDELLPGQPPFVPFFTLALHSPDSKYAVEQWTGISDKDGTEVYEGDILSIPNDRNHCVRYSAVLARWQLAVTTTMDIDGLNSGAETLWAFYDTGTVIGNVHQNPELLFS